MLHKNMAKFKLGHATFFENSETFEEFQLSSNIDCKSMKAETLLFNEN